MIRQARTDDTVLVQSRKMTGSEPNIAVVTGGRRGKDDRKQNIWAPLALVFLMLDSSFEAESQSKELNRGPPELVQHFHS
jgi:hypothetical protein